MICLPEEATASTAAARRGIAKLRHRGQGDRAGGGDIRRARDGAEQGWRHHQNLGGTALQPTRCCCRNVHETLTRFTDVKDRAKDYKDRHDRHRNPGQRAPDAALGNGQRPEETFNRRAGMSELTRHILSKQPVEQGECRHQRQRPADPAPGRFELHQEQRHRDRELKVAFNEAILVPEHIAVECYPKCGGNAERRADDAEAAIRLAGVSMIALSVSRGYPEHYFHKRLAAEMRRKIGHQSRLLRHTCLTSHGLQILSTAMPLPRGRLAWTGETRRW